MDRGATDPGAPGDSQVSIAYKLSKEERAKENELFRAMGETTDYESR